MKKSKIETAETRERIVSVAAEEFREHGLVATGLADLMSAAGLTHGGFYRHFQSKNQLIAEACASALQTISDRLDRKAHEEPERNRLKSIATMYLSPEHRDHPEQGCVLAALGGELSRADSETREIVTAGFLKMVDLISAQIDDLDPEEAKERAIVAASTMVGALTISRIVNDDSLSKTILKAAESSVCCAQ